MFSEDYVRSILALAPFVVCLSFSMDENTWIGHWRGLWLISALSFAVSVFQDWAAVWAALPWFLLITGKALSALRVFFEERNFQTYRVAALAALLYLPVGGVWALFDQLGFQPMGFSGIIVLLTGVHFHYAGFALPKLTSLWLSEAKPGRFLQFAAWGIILGVPLVAIGITSSQASLPFWIETGAVTILASSAFTLSVAQGLWALSVSAPQFCRILWMVGGLALATGMGLALIYGWRHVFVVEWATIPLMYALHGTLNSLGFCLPGFVAWKMFQRVGNDSGHIC